MSAPVPQAAVDLVCQFEGFSATPYRDPVGIWTIGYGSTRDFVGNPVTENTPPVTDAQARELVARDLSAACQSVRELVRVPLTTGEEAALDDFVYNLGAGNLRISTLLRLLNAGDYAAAAAQFPRWDMAGGHALAGLLRRREAEANLFNS